MNIEKFIEILFDSIGDHIEEANIIQVTNSVENILDKLEDEGYVKRLCVKGRDRCTNNDIDCQYCERRLLFR